MESISILSLNDDCFYNIVPYLDDFSSFYSFCLTCKRFSQLAEDDRNWHINVFKRKAEFYIRYIIVYGNDGQRKELRQLYCFLLEGDDECPTYHEELSYNDILIVWKRCGPVAAKFLSWITEWSRKEAPSGSPYLIEYTEQTFYLPICGEELSIGTSYFMDGWNFDQETKIEVSCGDLKIENEVSGLFPQEYDHWDEQEMRTVVDPMKPAIELLQKELGDTVPPITDQFFVWMCFRFEFLNEEHKIYFKDETKNAIPTLESLQPVLPRYGQNKAKQIEKDVEQWMREKDGSHSANQIARSLEILKQKSQTAILTQLREDVDRFPEVISNKDLRKAPQKLMFDLVTRTTLFRGNYLSEATPNKHVINKAHFRMKGGSVIKIDGEMHNNVKRWDVWDELTMTFSLPDWSKVEIPRTNFMYSLQSIDQKEDFIKKFSPITEILQECIDESMKDRENIPKIQNIFTFYYFLEVMQFSGVTPFFEECKQGLFEISSDESASDFLKNYKVMYKPRISKK